MNEPARRATINAVIIDKIAKVAHEVNRVYCQSIGDEAVPWDEASEQTKNSVRNGVSAILSHEITAPEQSHQRWYEYKKAEGWQYGPKKDEANKTHPCFMPFEELPPAQRYKDHFFFAVVTNVGAALSVYFPPG